MSDIPSLDETTGLDPRRRKAVLGATLVVIVVIAAVLGYASIRDPGPQPTVPPSISGTDDGSLKRAVVHYVGALESGDIEAVTDLMQDSSAQSNALAAAAIDEFGDAATRHATVEIGATEVAGTKVATVTFADGRVQQVRFTKTESGDSWIPRPS